MIIIMKKINLDVYIYSFGTMSNSAKNKFGNLNLLSYAIQLGEFDESCRKFDRKKIVNIYIRSPFLSGKK